MDALKKLFLLFLNVLFYSLETYLLIIIRKNTNFKLRKTIIIQLILVLLYFTLDFQIILSGIPISK